MQQDGSALTPVRPPRSARYFVTYALAVVWGLVLIAAALGRDFSFGTVQPATQQPDIGLTWIAGLAMIGSAALCLFQRRWLFALACAGIALVAAIGLAGVSGQFLPVIEAAFLIVLIASLRGAFSD